MLASFQKHIQDSRLFGRGDKILLTVSGGIDSMVMMHLFHLAGYQFGVAHCNFQLRGADSDADEAFVRQHCENLNVPFFSRRFDTNNYATASGLSTQMAARELRYLWFYEILAKEDYSFIATAHHLNDSIETTLLNLTRGAGVDGLSGIPLANEKVIRPLLFATRQQVEQYALENKMAWREDRSNASDDYQRNFIRHHILPKLRELNPSLESSIQRSQLKLIGTAEMAAVGMDQWKVKYLSQVEDRVLIQKAGLHTPYALAILYEIIKGYGFKWEQCQDIMDALAGQSGKKFLSSVYELVIDRQQLIVVAAGEMEEETQISLEQQTARLGSWTMEVEWHALNPGRDKTVAVLDYDKLQFPLRWRKWKAGDFFIPLGMQGRKKLSDYYVDIKLSQADKKTATVLESAGQIVWVVGHRIDERFKVTPDTAKAVAFTVTPYFV